MKVETPTYRLELSEDGLWATLRSPAGETWAPLRPLAALDTVAGVDETLAVSPPKALAGPVPTFEFERRSTVWERAGTTVVCREDAVEIRPWVRGRGELTDVHLLGGRSVIPGRPTGFLSSGSRFRTLFSPNPEEPDRPLRPATEPAAIGVSGDSEPGRRRWFFTPAPLVFALSVDEREWLGLELAAPVEELNFVELTYRPAGDAFSLLLDYDGHTHVDGRFEAPAVRITPGLADPYAALRGRREQGRRERAGWWSKPIFCGWGAQSHLAGFDGNPAADFATQEHYDRFLDHLERRGLVPGTVVVDDKWQEAYGTCVPDRAKWPDLRGWISERHARGQHILLWWKAWDPEALPPGLCIRNPDGAAVAFDPGNPLARETLCEIVESMLGADGLDADGLKVDFTARTPSGRSLSGRGRAWGIALLHELLATVYRAAKEAKQDALVITHTPHPSFVDVTDMIRLNDMVGAAGGSELTAQMRHRAEVVRAACPELLVDTDDWRVPDLESWRHYLQVKPELGVPSLYYATHLDATGEALTDGDYAALRDVWERARA